MTDEDVDTVDKWFAKKKPTYPIAILKGGFERFLGVKFFPTGAVIAPDGTLTYAGSAGATGGPLGDALDDAEKGGIWPKKLDKAAKLIQSGELIDAYGELLELVEGGKLTDEESSTADMFKSYLEGQAAQALAEGKSHSEAGFVLGAVQRLEPYAEASPPFPVTQECADLLKVLEAVPDFKKEMKGGEKFLEAQAMEDEDEYSDAFEEYKSIAKRYDGTKIAALARSRAQSLIEEGMPGFEKVCMECKKAGKACEKHAEDVSL